ncbi:hypothetical protein GQF61_09645 [Sphingobacterium sp. DK4209]|uniref:Uncharacterized protein n=1 Tax=Sphingobacterium zhuxiongii TaxID=2662364 RepID=A0A5Q0QCE8_9SPHI|nr:MULTISPECIES: hypothetical protein [unclassified Sphingobacterium]MVZ66120.1 hypothetical protein [Sphingobacterium sp. DK4209]QGA26541.1 hypothetical protein GFH32_09475 [Sphingobacterium sp. dk4302]
MLQKLLLISIACLLYCSSTAQSWTALKKEQQPIMTFTVNDTLSFPVFVVENPADKALYYGTQLQTNVCNDQICLPIEVNLFWDLLGNYHHFSKEESFHFTKFDHKYFDEKDYERLQSILIDSLSPLRDYDVEDLLDKQEKKYSLEIDAVTKPTSALFSNVTVPGALYTVYTLWHIVNGPIKQELNAYANKQYVDRKWASYFANSDVSAYQEYFLKHLDPKEEVLHQDAIINLLFAKDDFTPHYAIDVLENRVLKTPALYNPILKRFDSMKPHVISEIINSISAPNTETKTILKAFQNGPKASPKQKELIEKILNYEKQ